MTIVDAHLYRYRLPLTDALAVGTRTLTERRGLLLRLDGPKGATGWGEAAPLPGFSEDGLGAAASHGRRVARDLPEVSLPESDVDDVLRALSGGDAPPSVRFAVESAVVELLADMRDQNVVQALGGGAATVSMNALIPNATDDLESAAERVRERGYRAVKLKVGRRGVEADATRVQALRGLLEDDVSLRLDANRAWTIEEADAFASALGNVPIEYVEEPLRDPARLADLMEATGLPVALDETTREGAPEAVPDDLSVQAVVLKPTLLGGLTAARQWARWGEQRGAVPVVSASYESGVGLRMLGALVASLSEAPAGLSTYTWLETDVLRPRLPLDGAHANIDQMYASTVDRSILEPIESAQ